MGPVYKSYLDAYLAASSRIDTLAGWIDTNMSEPERLAVALAVHHVRKDVEPMPKAHLRGLLRRMLSMRKTQAPAAQGG